eukprot:TRINITY_DN37132_c0_g2_i1.p1 TRINITY_DN37132_c0_g2~~TRINITY_DN37132_c0_g2_i1.p1  ORF type:complete len:283 (+),score=63.94 TRINITY_DN37132_c0_g2_i1:107-955(+)
MIRRPPRSTLSSSSAASDVYKRQTRDALVQIFEDWQQFREDATPITRVRAVMDRLRTMPQSPERRQAMVTMVRTIGTPDRLACYLEMQLDSDLRYPEGTDEKYLVEKAKRYKTVSAFGHCHMALCKTDKDERAGTLGAPHHEWSLAFSVWKPVSSSFVESVTKRHLDNVLIEPPHKHPYEFASKIVKGSMRQSVYTLDSDGDKQAASSEERYKGVALTCVDGAWPPHEKREECWLRVELKAVSYTHLRAHETPEHLVCRLLLEKKKKTNKQKEQQQQNARKK